MSPKQLAAMALAAAALTVAGCGGSKNNSTTTTSAATATTPAQSTSATNTTAAASGEPIKISTGTPLARSTWIRKGDAICARANSRLSTTTAKTVQDFARLLPQSAGYEREEATQLAKLTPPHGMEADYQQLVTDLQRFSEYSSKAGEYAARNKWQEALPIATAGNKSQEQLIRIAKHDGFKVCSIP